MATGQNDSGTNANWFHHARFGMFVHFGLYSLLGRGEWAMCFENIPASEYNKTADQFRAEKFDARDIAALARRAGAGYVVFTTRHHDGFCLWDTQTTDFNTVRTAAKRDLVREYVDACREADLRVGLYYSVMSWQHQAIVTGPLSDPDGWRVMVDETHAQVRELMTDYGQVDYLWYDGCVVPGLGEPSLKAKYWEAKELNAMVRELQPGILINDRAALPEDVFTPEQYLMAPPRGFLWELCQTIGEHWGWKEDDTNLKDANELIKQMIFCARHEGNFLLNIGPCGDGSLPSGQVDRFDEIGRWMRVNGKAIRNSERTAYSEAEHLLGPATCRDCSVYFHLSEWPEELAMIAGVDAPVESARLLGNDATTLSFDQEADGCVVFSGLHTERAISGIEVLEVNLSRKCSGNHPPSLLIERETGRHLPAEGPVNPIEIWEMHPTPKLAFPVPASGKYHLDLGVISSRAQDLEFCLDAGTETGEMRVECARYPTTMRIADLVLTKGQHQIELKARDPLGIYLWRIQPVWEILGVEYWSTLGPFPTEFSPRAPVALVREAMKTIYSPEEDPSVQDGYVGVHGRKIHWRRTDANGSESVNLGLLCGGDSSGVCYARTIVYSPEERLVSILLSCDWWANLYVDGQIISSERQPEAVETDGAWFSGWKPIPACIPLQAGVNEILVKCHPGSTDNWFTFFINNPGDLQYPDR